MGKYGQTAVQSIASIRSENVTAESAWNAAVNDVFPDSVSSREKACPREAFLGLCDAGLITGITATTGSTRKHGPNRQYAITAVELLTSLPQLANGSSMNLWRHVLKALKADAGKRHNQQMDVVLSLWNNQFVRQKIR